MQLLIEQNGNVLDLSNSAIIQSLTSTWRSGASKFEFSIIKDSKFTIANGSYLKFGEMFAGTVFSVESDEDVIKIVAYDQLRYLKNKDTLFRKNMTLMELIGTIAALQKVRVGMLADTQIKLTDYLYDNQTYLDMIYKGINDNLLANGYMYHLYDNAGAIELADLIDLRLPIMLGDSSGVSKYSYKKSIDDDTYNQIKLTKDNKTTGKRDAYIVNDSGTIAKYGILQYYEKVNENLNDAQIKERADRLIKLKNRETETLYIKECQGDIRIRGGSGIKLQLENEGIDTWAIVNKVTHKFGSIHEMSLELIFERR